MDTLKYIKEKYGVPDDTVKLRLKNVRRNDLYPVFAELGFKKGAEVGVCWGRNANEMLQKIPDLKLYCVDSWKPVGSRDDFKQEHYYKKMTKTLKPYLENGQAVLVEKWSMDAVRDFENKSLDFVYIDANHNFDFVMQDIIEWSKKVRKGGIVSGHDYYRSQKEGVVHAVKAYTKAHKIKPWFVLDNENGSVRSKNSWFWVKEK